MAKGYTKIENSLFDFMTSGTLKGAELEVMWFLIRYTKGFGRDTTRAAYSFIAKGLNCSEYKVKKAVKGLIAKGYISVLYQASGCKAQVVQINWLKLTTYTGSFEPPKVYQMNHDKVYQMNHQDITQDITNYYIKEEEREISDSEWEKMKQEGFDD